MKLAAERLGRNVVYTWYDRCSLAARFHMFVVSYLICQARKEDTERWQIVGDKLYMSKTERGIRLTMPRLRSLLRLPIKQISAESSVETVVN